MRLSRRAALASMAAGLAPRSVWSQSEVTAPNLRTYFAANAPQLLRPAGGILRYPSISPSLPKAEYSTQLWDWDTLWTARGLFRVAVLGKDREFHARVCDHARGSLLRFRASIPSR